MHQIKTKLKAEIRPHSISYLPNRKVRTNYHWVWLSLIGAAVIVGYMYYRYDLVGVLAGLGIILIFVIYDLVGKLMKQNIRYNFDKTSNAIYKSSYFGSSRKLMPLDEAIIFRHSSSGSWEYRVGKKGKQFMKSYKISPAFGDGKKEEELIAEFEREILGPVSVILSSPLK